MTQTKLTFKQQQPCFYSRRVDEVALFRVVHFTTLSVSQPLLNREQTHKLFKTLTLNKTLKV